MARLPRLSVAGQAHHVVQRGNDGQAIFRDEVDRRQMLQLLETQAREHRVALHAYVLMDNHVHLLLTPATAEGLPKMMQAVGRRYVRWFNDRHGRSGTLWEGRYRSTVIEAERHLLPCMAYIDLNPVRAGLVAQAADYPWSSHTHHIGQRADRLVTPHALYWALGNTPFAREAAYTRLVAEGLTQQQQEALTDSAFKGWALGGPEFMAALQKQTARRLSKGKAGRPAGRVTGE
ncbi:transposase [Hylemonella gracilis str. Niagara R]|uniref:Transposase n=1 Tax=Hylemonella gracilis str. Niagara R TaxID=1458275 RepID=A0A016XL24_9BURK|nr:transposase [Hylemonella gracilis]EYC52282.1 transposase [Hylemonella gracilis str. Niagara R]